MVCWLMNGSNASGLNGNGNFGITRESTYTSNSDTLTSNGGNPSKLTTEQTISSLLGTGGSSLSGNNSSILNRNDAFSLSRNRSRTFYDRSSGADWVSQKGNRNAGISAFGDDYSTGQRYLSTIGNHVSGESKSTNDQFMRLNAFLGSADLSMILHMLSQRSDTDLLSAPKVLTRPGEEAVMKVVTEYIYPTDYDVQLQSSSSSGGGNSYGGGGSQSAILAVVEPQSFTMREVGVILQVTPTLTDDGNVVDLELNTQVVDEPTWKNYGMRIPFTGNASAGNLQVTLGNGPFADQGYMPSADIMESIVTRYWNAVANMFENISGGNQNITYYDAPMEQPFFHVRSVDSKVSVYPGATIVMGGLITEARKAMDDKIPFLGDIPFVGRFFRSHSEQTSKRNLLIFVTTRIVDGRGREMHNDGFNLEEPGSAGEVKSAPEVAAE